MVYGRSSRRRHGQSSVITVPLDETLKVVRSYNYMKGNVLTVTN
jgi:hypothetical protein